MHLKYTPPCYAQPSKDRQGNPQKDGRRGPVVGRRVRGGAFVGAEGGGGGEGVQDQGTGVRDLARRQHHDDPVRVGKEEPAPPLCGEGDGADRVGHRGSPRHAQAGGGTQGDDQDAVVLRVGQCLHERQD